MVFLINSYSFVVIGLLILLILTSITWRLLGFQWMLAIGAITLVFLIGFQLMATTKSSIIANQEDFNEVLRSGEPVVLELYSNFWIACLRAKPAVDRLEHKLKNHYRVIRIDVNSDLGKYISKKYQRGVVPTFIVFDKGGTEVWRHSGNVPKPEKILEIAF